MIDEKNAIIEEMRADDVSEDEIEQFKRLLAEGLTEEERTVEFNRPIEYNRKTFDKIIIPERITGRVINNIDLHQISNTNSVTQLICNILSVPRYLIQKTLVHSDFVRVLDVFNAVIMRDNYPLQIGKNSSQSSSPDDTTQGKTQET